ncbi:DeoR/GlpR transcriptional regulator [Salmonella enterica subsp. enterica]|uniref:DeoR/GlpR transcriptional regulator n=3 Tax=Salmonella enterica TaxID=28901 RepID=A0A5U7LXZ1_SALER|nr:DeoR/GlpR family DNA-binding transcription regulator [Salmonella enterica]EAW2243195.1 DeoR/GlpR transcriptional regulator [Salmonella enterica subsp. enterica]ECS6014252.1 DeoR/GlpR transcriptional regulator [Salmonella enterica subsp. enterica serovar Rough O:k:1,5]ECS7546262.1 DeoR/GlpR transcriptional regulator [Salmonella enterica subsp. enterica serovar Denver]EDU3494780.1 DeoR/GlpR transcriptional regulator [Salmonella enterica subsp. enterica serovar Brazos]EDU6322085.1 DeoR/GlpR tr
MNQQRPDRIKQMLHYLWQHRHLSTQQAIELFGYAEATVRRDFHYIASRYPGMVRGHGCIDFDDSTEDKEYVFDVKRTLQSEAKREIAALARTFIKDGDCFFLDSGSTCLELAKCLVDAKVKVICNDIKIANELGGFPHVESYIIGGLIRPGYFSVGESLALEMINAFAVERAFISCDALSIETGITNATMFEVGVKTRIIQRSREVILMADHSKFDTVEPHAVATLSCITTILSDSALPSAIARRYQQAGCRLIMSDPSSGAR